MKKEIRVVSPDGKTVQITTPDERWYVKDSQNALTGVPSYTFVPSVTYITHYYPKGASLLRWYAQHGWDEAQALKQAAGDKGTKVHLAAADLVEGKTVAMDAKYLNKTTGQEEELTVQEWECLMAFVAWYSEAEYEVLASEYLVWSDTHGYAGTVDMKVCRKSDGAIGILDLKTSQDVWPEHELQVSAYKHADGQEDVSFVAILQVGYRRNKAGWKFTEVPDRFSLFLNAKAIWEHETAGVAPLQRDYPLRLALPLIPTESPEKPAKGKGRAKTNQAA